MEFLVVRPCDGRLSVLDAAWSQLCFSGCCFKLMRTRLCAPNLEKIMRAGRHTGPVHLLKRTLLVVYFFQAPPSDNSSSVPWANTLHPDRLSGATTKISLNTPVGKFARATFAITRGVVDHRGRNRAERAGLTLPLCCASASRKDPLFHEKDRGACSLAACAGLSYSMAVDQQRSLNLDRDRHDVVKAKTRFRCQVDGPSFRSLVLVSPRRSSDDLVFERRWMRMRPH